LNIACSIAQLCSVSGPWSAANMMGSNIGCSIAQLSMVFDPWYIYFLVVLCFYNLVILALPIMTPLVIDRKRIFLFRPKTNIRQENAAKYSADNEYSAQGSKHCKKVNLYKEKNSFLGWQLQVAVDGHHLWATETCMQKTLTMLT
jgi:hypothetical protein